MDDAKILNIFEEDCRSAITTFENTLHNYDYEKHGDFHQYAINAARAAKIAVSNKHYYAIREVQSSDLTVFKRFLDILNSAFETINDEMDYTSSYYEFVDYLYIKRNNLEHV